MLNLAMKSLQLQWWIFLGPTSLAWAHNQGHSIPVCMLPRPWQPSMGMQLKLWHTRDDLNHACIDGPWAIDGALLILEKWRPNLVLSRLQLNHVSLWVQLHGLPLEYHYLELAERMGQLIGIFERVDWEDQLPRNIIFMRVRVLMDPWMLVFTGFMLRLDDGSRVWVQCRYESVHKLCTRCGLIGHSRGHCTQDMDEIERWIHRQRRCIQ